MPGFMTHLRLRWKEEDPTLLIFYLISSSIFVLAY